MNVSLTPELEQFTRALVQSGRFRSASEVVRESLRLLEDREAETLRLRQLMQEALESGPAQPFDREELRSLVRDRLAEVRVDAESGRTSGIADSARLSL